MHRWPYLWLACLACAPEEQPFDPPHEGTTATDSEPAADTDAPTPVEVVDIDSLSYFPHHRLNIDEIRHAFRDVLHVDSAILDTMPLDPVEGPFRNQPVALEISELFLDRLAAATVEVARATLADRHIELKPPHIQYEAEFAGWSEGYELPSTFIVPMGSPWWVWFSDTPQNMSISAVRDGRYTISVQAARPAPEWDTGSSQLSISLDGTHLDTFEVTDGTNDPVLLVMDVTLTAGDHTLEFEISEGSATPPADPVPVPRYPPVPAMAVDFVELVGPHEPEVAPVSPRSALITCEPAVEDVVPCAKQILEPLARRAWRRPVGDQELTDIVQMVQDAMDQGLGFEVGLEYGIRRILMSPHFLFRMEFHPRETFSIAEPAAHPMLAFEVATRLSMFLWASVPDDELFDCAASGDLLRPDGGSCSLESQLERMLDDPKADSLVHQWAYQWLGLREMEDVFKVWDLMPDFTLLISEDMVEETESVLHHFIQHDEPMTNLAQMDWSYLNNRLARYYGLEPPGFDTLTPVTHGSPQRSGLLTHGSLMALTAGEGHTNPIRRAVWMLDSFLCTYVGAPPPDVPAIDIEAVTDDPIGTLDLHATPGCNSCHAILDPIGLALENYDPAGGWRDETHLGVPIEIDMELSGRRIQHPADLSAYIADDDRFGSCLTAKLGSYGSGVAYLHYADANVVEEIRAAADADGMSFEAIAKALVHHPVFTHHEAITPSGETDE